MSLFDFIFGKRPKPAGTYDGGFRMLTGHAPKFHGSGGDVYEEELIRAAIHARATHISKLVVTVQGAARPALQNKLKHGPNQFQTWGQFLYRLSTILDVHNTAFIVPVYDDYGEPSGVFTPLPERCEMVSYDGVPYLRYKFRREEPAAIELAYCGVMTKHQYRSDFFGESNHPLLPTMDLLKIQEQGIQEGVKSAATYRFMAKVNNFTSPDDLKNERKRFTEENFSRESEGGGLLLFPNTYTDIRQLDAKPWTADAETLRIIRENVMDYFGVNEDVLQNKVTGDAWAAFYEGAIEPFAVQFSEVMTKMLFTFREQSQGNLVMATSNRIQYMSNADKLAVTQGFADRGLATIDELREIWNLPPLPNGLGEMVPIRGEYYDLGASALEGDNNGEEGDQGV